MLLKILYYGSANAPGKPAGVSYNPNADRALHAHELGHVANQATDIGHYCYLAC